MASFDGPATSQGNTLGGPPAAAEPSSTPLTAERSQQELSRLAEIVKNNKNLHFLEPRVEKCKESGSLDTLTLLSFYRLISQTLSEELEEQRERIARAETDLVQAKQSSAQQQMEAAFQEASQVVEKVTHGSNLPASTAGSSAVLSGATLSGDAELLKHKLEQAEVQC